MQRRNMRQEMITEEELLSLLREQGIDSVSEVKKCYLEGDGRISVITGEAQQGGNNQNSQAGIKK